MPILQPEFFIWFHFETYFECSWKRGRHRYCTLLVFMNFIFFNNKVPLKAFDSPDDIWRFREIYLKICTYIVFSQIVYMFKLSQKTKISKEEIWSLYCFIIFFVGAFLLLFAVLTYHSIDDWWINMPRFDRLLGYCDISLQFFFIFDCFPHSKLSCLVFQILVWNKLLTSPLQKYIHTYYLKYKRF